MRIQESRQWNFAMDMDLSGSITISDVAIWIKWLYFYPGDALLYIIVHRVPVKFDYLGMLDSTYYGVLSGVLSALVWVMLFHLLNYNRFHEED